MVRPLAIIHRRHHPPGAAAAAFMELLRQANGHGAAGTGPQPQTQPAPSGRNGAARRSQKRSAS
jgi:hypothetical protein